MEGVSEGNEHKQTWVGRFLFLLTATNDRKQYQKDLFLIQDCSGNTY